jgi:phage FluMu gp28-like protein
LKLKVKLQNRFPFVNMVKEDSPVQRNRRFYAGYDPAKINDRSAFCMLEEMDDGILETRMFLNLQGMDYKRQVPEVVRICKTYNVRVLEIDATGHEHIWEELRDALGRGRVKKVVFTKQIKEDLILNLRLLCMDKMLKLGKKLKFYSQLRKELHDLDPDKLDHQKGGSSDLLWSLALACDAAANKFIQAKKIVLPFMDR